VIEIELLRDPHMKVLTLLCISNIDNPKVNTMNIKLIGFCMLVLFSSCIGDDFIENGVPPQLRIIGSVDTIKLGETFQMEAMFINNVGQETDVTIDWESSDEEIISVSETGLLDAKAVQWVRS